MKEDRIKPPTLAKSWKKISYIKMKLDTFVNVKQFVNGIPNTKKFKQSLENRKVEKRNASHDEIFFKIIF